MRMTSKLNEWWIKSWNTGLSEAVNFENLGQMSSNTNCKRIMAGNGHFWSRRIWSALWVTKCWTTMVLGSIYVLIFIKSKLNEQKCTLSFVFSIGLNSAIWLITFCQLPQHSLMGYLKKNISKISTSTKPHEIIVWCV